MPGKREDVISWDEFFMRAAVAASMGARSLHLGADWGILSKTQ